MFENSFRKGITNAIEQAHLCNQYIAGRPIKSDLCAASNIRAIPENGISTRYAGGYSI